MPLSKAHRATLEHQVEAHTKEVAALCASRASVDKQVERREAGAWSDPNPKPGHGIAVLTDKSRLIKQQIERHLALIALGSDERLLHTLGELIDDPGLVAQASRDPRAFAKARSIDLPVTMQVELRQVDGHPRLTVVNYDRLAPFTLVWDREGFRLIR